MDTVARGFLLRLFAAIGLLILHNEALAGSATATMTNTVTIVSSCSIATTGFTTTYDPIVANLTSPQTATASVTTTCTIGALPVITLGQGVNPATGSTATAPLRQVKNGTYLLSYGLYQDSGHATVWGGTTATAPPAVAASGTATAITIYASIPAGQAGATGTYTDSVIATVTY